jgi:hypothetical protein
VLYKDQYFKNGDNGKEMVGDPIDCSGLMVRKGNGVDVNLRLQESEAAI